jgi:hypothetical protein
MGHASEASSARVDPLTEAHSRVIGEARDCDELVDLYRQRKVELGLTDLFFDEHSGLTQGHIGKFLGAVQLRTRGPVSIATLNATLAVKFVMVVDD